MSDDELVLYEVSEGVATVTLNRPERMNAWTNELEARYFDVLEQADNDPDVRAIVVTGAGRGFCPGMDANVLQERAGARSGPTTRVRPMTYPLTVRKLMIAAINGGCAGIGFIQALCCDVRFSASSAKIATAFTRRGLAPEFGASWLLTRIVGVGHAADLLLSARPITGAEAQEIGLVNRSVDGDELMTVALAYARDVAANCSPRAIAYAKGDLLADWTRTLVQAEDDSLRVFDRVGHSDDFEEGVRSFVDKRAPAFVNLGPRP